jgi:RHS repeat-associated protein
MTGTSAQHVYLQLTDALGSTSSTIDLASSQLVEQITYSAYGGGESDYRAPGWDSFRESYRYTGKEDDYQVGLVYFGQRYLFSALGRWASADPLNIQALGGEPNPYTFVRGSPLRFTDSEGFQDDDGDDGPAPGTEAAGDAQTLEVQAEIIANESAANVVTPELNAAIAQVIADDDALAAAIANAASGSGGQFENQGAGPTVVAAGASAAVAADGPQAVDTSFRAFMSAMEPPALTATRGYLLTGVLAGAYVPRVVWALAAGVAATQVRSGADTAGVAAVVSLGAGFGGAPVVDELAPLRFSQTTASARFSAEGFFAGKTIGGLAADLRVGVVAPRSVSVGFVNLGGSRLIVNTRSALALIRAGVPLSGQTLIDMTATDAASIQVRLLSNGLTTEGTPTIRITGLGGGASNLE